MSLFTAEELEYLTQHPETLNAKNALIKSKQKLFQIDIPESIQTKLKREFGIHASTIPMRWFKGDTPEHADTGSGTVLVYLTDSQGEFIVNGVGHPIKANTPFCFKKGVLHRASGTGSEPRLVMGPMDSTGHSVGIPTGIYYYSNEADALAQNGNFIASTYGYTVGDVNYGSIGATTKWAVYYDNELLPIQYTNGTNIGYPPYINNIVYMYPANLSWSIPDIPNNSSKLRCFASDLSGSIIIAHCDIYSAGSNYPFGTFDTGAAGVYMSLDAGSSWHLSYSTTDYVSSIICNQTASCIYINLNSSLLHTTDTGVTWNETSVVDATSFCCNEAGHIVYYGSNNTSDTICISTDFGASFTNVFDSQTGLPIGFHWGHVCCDAIGTTVYAACTSVGQGIYKSVDSGATWTFVSGAPSGGSVQYYVNENIYSAIQCTPDGSIINAAFMSNADGFYHGAVTRSIDSGTTWGISLNTSIAFNYIQTMCSDISGNIIVQFTDGSNITYKGITVPHPPGTAGYTLNSFVTPLNDYIIVGGYNTQLSFKSTNLGTSYTKLSIPINQWTGVACNDTGNVIVAVTNNQSSSESGIFISTNKGATWTQNTGYTDDVDSWNGVAVNASGNVIVVCGDDYEYIATTFNGGATWTIGDTTDWWTEVAVNGSGSIIYACANQSSLYKCTDSSGLTWVELTGSALPSSGNWSSIACDSTGARVIAGDYGGGLYYSSDSGATWSIITNVPPDIAWQSVSSSASGERLVACSTNNMSYGFVAISNDFGVNWLITNDAAFDATAISRDGLVAYTGMNIANGSQVLKTFTSDPSGWAPTVPLSPYGNWKTVATNQDGSFIVGVMYTGPLLLLNASIPCFLESTLIETKEGCVKVETLRKGDLVKTKSNGYLPIESIGKRPIKHSAIPDRIKDQLYRYPESGLVVTGCHSVLVDNFVDEIQRQKTMEVLGDIFVTDNKYRLPACVDERSEVYPEPGNYTVYHFALENNNMYTLYGVYANGMLVESCSKRYMKELSGMELID
jgi:hypothetical protein